MLPIIVAGAWFGWRTFVLAHPSANLAKNKVAVLYFDDLSSGKTLGDLGNGLTAALIRQLDVAPQLDVASSNGSLFFKGRSNLTIDSVARVLKVGTLINGRLTPIGGGIRIDVDFWDGTTGWRVGTARIEQASGNAIALQDSLSHLMTRVLRRRIGEPTLEVVSRPGTRNSTAWDAIQRGRRAVLELDSLTRAGATAEVVGKVAQADSILAVAQAMDEYWVEPHIERAQLAYQAARLRASNVPFGPQQIDSGLAHADAAVELAPNDSRALEIRGTLRYWRWLTRLSPDSAASARLLDSAEVDLSAAASRERSRAAAWNVLSHLLLNRGQLPRAAAAAERAFELDPFLPGAQNTIQRLFLASLQEGYADQAIRWCREGQRRYPEDYRSVECGLWLFTLPGSKIDMTEAWARYDDYMARSPKANREFYALKGRMLMAFAAVRAGLPDSAKHLAAAALGDDIVDPQGQLTNLAAIVHLQLGDRDAALGLLARYVNAGLNRRTGLAQDKSFWLRELRTDPRYRTLIRPRTR
jgi:TolB-like protein